MAGPRTIATGHGLWRTRLRGVLPSQNAAARVWLLDWRAEVAETLRGIEEDLSYTEQAMAEAVEGRVSA